MKVVHEQEGPLHVKRFYVDSRTWEEMTHPCNCGEEQRIFSQGYISYPTAGKTQEIEIMCENCDDRDDHVTILVTLNVSVEVESDET